ncbi:chain-length determining protein [Psychromonas sp. psych-6C06]|uniref:GumC family protein n=1 Tax=Psychromonas sp. psych-6C06 TaxID=2058089 RepID=UPI000C34231E|nr:chain-length determining protein [Psychromonas sp. psych-6C06]PKF62487.1 chain-length determining protein [Psychromonas sp. psych-6C06]
MNSLNYRFYFILAGAWRRRYSILIPMIILPLLASLLSFISPKNYASHTSMLIQETSKLNPFLEDLAVSSMLKERINSLKILLHSRHILGAVASEQGLVDEHTTAAQHDHVIAQLSNALSIEMLGKDLIRIDYQSNSPLGMKEMLESVSTQFIEQVLAPERSSMNDSSRFLAEHLNKRQIELDKAELAMAQYKDANANELPELYLTNISRLAQMKQRLAERQATLDGASRSLGGINQQLSKTNPVLGLIEQKIIVLQSELALLQGRYTNQHSKVVTAVKNLNLLQEERQKLLNAIETNQDENLSIEKLWAIGNNYQINNSQLQNATSKQPLLISQLENMQLTSGKVQGLIEEVKSLKSMIAEIEQQIASYGANASLLSKLEREVAVKRDLYDDMLVRFEKAGITSSLGVFEQDKRVKVIDRPFTPTRSTNKPLILFIISGLIGGILLGCGLAIIQELSDSTLRTREHLHRLTGAPVFSRIPRIHNSLNNERMVNPVSNNHLSNNSAQGEFA